MIYKQPGSRLSIRILLLAIEIFAASYLIFYGQILFGVLVIAVAIYQCFNLYEFLKKAQDEVTQFVESIHYRDFSRYFDVKHAPAELQGLRQGFNEINSTFKVISIEKETQYQYLQKILELVDTGILSYEIETGNIVWMNESLKRLLKIPFLRTIQSLDRRDPSLCAVIVNLRPGESLISDIHIERNTLKILVAATAFQTEGKKYKLIAFQNVNEALDETESKAWQKLLRVMTHEIMNSVAPISSLADTLKNRLQNSQELVDDESGTLEDLSLGMETIKRRSEGLLKFAQTYRNLNMISAPNLQKFYVKDLFKTQQRLMLPTLDQKNIDLEIILKEPELQLEADINLIEQVLINLLLNAIEAVKESENPKIILTASQSANGRVAIKVIDNGSGIEDEVLDKIFIPFFSTKKSGSGIGLSLCKQIMMLHKGNIHVQSAANEGTAFILQF
ncbi:MAG TPA: HAMP domain-containing sensor histidine kinase [Parafilimonas sp.]|nr:HAMP domain-containing sensor histidine kinase [Parafilimonas sp.]